MRQVRATAQLICVTSPVVLSFTAAGIGLSDIENWALRLLPEGTL